MATVLGNGKKRQPWLQRSLRTKDKKEAKRLAPPILMELDRVLAEAEASIAEEAPADDARQARDRTHRGLLLRVSAFIGRGGAPRGRIGSALPKRSEPIDSGWGAFRHTLLHRAVT